MFLSTSTSHLLSGQGKKSVESLFVKRKIEAKCTLCINSRGQDPLPLSLLLQVLTELPSGDRSIAYVLHKMAMLCKYKVLMLLHDGCGGERSPG